MKQFFNGIIGSFYGKDGYLSLSKVMAFAGYMVFLIVSVILLKVAPEKFDYTTFAILAAGSSTGIRVLDKQLNLKGVNTNGQSASI